jgi:transposase InsO family protein
MNVRNKEVSLDWAMINKENIPGEFNVFAVFYDMNIGLVHVEFQNSRGQADEALLGYIQRYGQSSTLIYDNAREFTDGNFAKICKEKGITQRMSAPYTPNQNPTEKYMDVLVSGARSLLYTAGLNTPQFWKHAVEHRTYRQNIMALPGRCSPDELTTGK